MAASLHHAVQEIERFRVLIAIFVPLLGGALAVASTRLTPRGKAKGLVTGMYMILASLGAACLCFGIAGLILGMRPGELSPLFVLGIALTVIMGIFTPEVIREYQSFEIRKLAAEIFRRS